MFMYYFDLALRSFRSARGLTALMVLTIAMGIGASMTTLTTFRALSGDPLPGLSETVLRVQLDAARRETQTPGKEPDSQLTRFDAEALLRDRHAWRQAAMSGGSVSVEPAADAPGALKPFTSSIRYTTADFFAMFGVPFKFGQGWTAGDDADKAALVVLSKEFNEKVFGGVNSVGKTLRFDNADYRVIGVLDAWQPVPYFFDLNVGRYRKTEGIFLPLSMALERHLGNNGSVTCWGDNSTPDFRAVDAPCSWVQYWAQVHGPAERQAYLDYLNQYSAQQHAAGRFERVPNARAHPVMEWLSVQQVVPSDVRLQLWLAFGFLAVCLVNTVGLLLAKCLRRAPEIGVRRALGASRRAIFAQFLVEAGTIGLAGGALGLAFSWFGVWVVHGGTQSGAQWVHMDVETLVTTFVLAVGATLLAGLVPAWRACDVSPASQLKAS
jgi:putative ABC transport system permease protein